MAVSEGCDPSPQASEVALVIGKGTVCVAGVTPPSAFSNPPPASASYLCFGAALSTAAPPFI